MATFDDFIASLRLEFGEQDAGKKFEVFCKWFLENDPEWSRSIDKVWLWDDVCICSWTMPACRAECIAP